MKIVFASGKGGTGKTTVAVNFAYSLAHSNQIVQYLDCDVEEPNGHLFLKPSFNGNEPCTVPLPVVSEKECTFCGDCGGKCQFHAIVNLPATTLVFPELCHGCGLCTVVCPEGAITESKREVGIIEEGTGIQGIRFVHGILKVGEPMAVPLIRAVKSKGIPGSMQIIDAPPGTSCPVVATMGGADMVVLVTEPTPFGLHDLKLALSVARNLDLPVGVIVNRNHGEYSPLSEYLSKDNIKILAVIPDRRDIAEACSNGSLIFDALPDCRHYFSDLAINIGKVLGASRWRQDHE